jgi:pyruvate/2-oxoglutarate dehydrogenase complex dihydrolipoamide acyltransferase (E2) component
MVDIVLDPALIESLEAGTAAYIADWLVAEGDHVVAGQTLARARLVQQLVDVPAPHAGIVEQILVALGERFAPGTVLARLVAL